jgi:peroxiredoxin Q/BCP
MKKTDRITHFELPDQDGEIVSSESMLAEGPMVVYFYIKAKTPG